MPPEVQAFLEGVSAWAIIGWVALFVTVFGAVRKWVWPLLKGLANFLDDMAGEPARPGVPARPGIMARLESVEVQLASIETRQESQGTTLDAVHHELFPNSGKSMRDGLDRVEAKLDQDNERISDLDTSVVEVKEKVGALDEVVTAHIEQSEAILKTLQEKDES